MSLHRGGLFLCLVVGAALCARPVAAETLLEALSAAYLVNPTLNAERARLRATDEDVARAKSGLRPRIFGTGDVSFLNTQSTFAADSGGGGGGGDTGLGVLAQPLDKPPLTDVGVLPLDDAFGAGEAVFNDGVTHPRGYAVELSQPIFQGFRNLNAIREAKATVQAGRESLRNIEKDTLLEATIAYVEVVQNQAIVRLEENNVEVLTEQLKATRDRFEVGEVTRTDVAQSEARRSDALSRLAVAQADLKESRARFERVVGHPPSSLVNPPSISHLLPRTLDEAMTLGDGENPEVLSAVYREEASLYAVNRIVGELLPDVSVEAQYQKRFDLGRTLSSQEETRVMGRLNVPFYQGGDVAARIRQAKELNNQLKREVEAARLQVHRDVIASWGFLQSSGPQIAAAKSSVEANRIALAGVQEEEKVGQRTTLDVLDAQLEFVRAQINLVVALRTRIEAEYSLYAAIGRLDAQSLGLSVPYYDPIEHYDRVKNKFWGLTPPPPPEPSQ